LLGIAAVGASGGAALQLARIDQGGQGLGRSRQRIAARLGLGALDRIPVLLHLRRRLGVGRQRGDRLSSALEHVRVTANQLVGDVAGDG
jgi:hypothetical protein